MSPALQKLRKDLDQAKARSKGADAAATGGHSNSVGFDVMDMLFSALVAQDAEIRHLKAERNTGEVVSEKSEPTTGGCSSVRAKTDAYIGHTEANLTSLVYSVKHIKPAHG